MLAESRRRLLLDRIARQGFATLDELVKSLGVSESTVRRDLEALDLAGAVRRTHGGALFVDLDASKVAAAKAIPPLPPFEDRTATRHRREAGDWACHRRLDRRRRHDLARRRDHDP